MAVLHPRPAPSAQRDAGPVEDLGGVPRGQAQAQARRPGQRALAQGPQVPALVQERRTDADADRPDGARELDRGLDGGRVRVRGAEPGPVRGAAACGRGPRKSSPPAVPCDPDAEDPVLARDSGLAGHTLGMSVPVPRRPETDLVHPDHRRPLPGHPGAGAAAGHPGGSDSGPAVGPEGDRALGQLQVRGRSVYPDGRAMADPAP